jgi:hypothetical protein
MAGKTTRTSVVSEAAAFEDFAPGVEDVVDDGGFCWVVETPVLTP